jgi:very-short-patch-repair endonuclease
VDKVSHDEISAAQKRRLDELPQKSSLADERLKIRLRNELLRNAKTINESKKEMARIIKQLTRWQERGHLISVSDRESLCKELPREFWHLGYESSAVDKNALQIYCTAKKRLSDLDFIVNDHNSKVAATLMQSTRGLVEEALNECDFLMNGWQPVDFIAAKIVRAKFPFQTWEIAQNSQYLTSEEFGYFSEAFNRLDRFEKDALDRNEVISDRQRFIDRVHKGGKANFLFCLLCSEIFWPTELSLKNLTLETFEELVVCPRCSNSLEFLLDAAGVGERFVCPRCNKIEGKTRQQFLQSAWYCDECYASLSLDQDGKAIVNRDWAWWYRSSDKRVVPSDEHIEEWALKVTALFKQSSNAQKLKKRTFLRRQAEETRLVKGEINPRVPQSESRFSEHVLRDEAATIRNGWNWEHQKVLFDQYIVDFYCEFPRKDADPLRFVIELDGPDHCKDPKLFLDQIRNVHSRDAGYLTLRIWNARADRPYTGNSVDGAELAALIGIVEEWFRNNVDDMR